MRKIAAFYADTHREAQAVLKHIDGDVLEKMDFYLDAVGCRENPEEHSCEYAFREFCYGSPKTKKQLVIHDFVAPMDKEIVVPSLTYNYRSNLELELRRRPRCRAAAIAPSRNASILRRDSGAAAPLGLERHIARAASNERSMGGHFSHGVLSEKIRSHPLRILPLEVP